MRRLLLDTAWVLASRLLMRGANLVALVLLARALPVAEFGFYGFLVATTLILTVALDLGVRQASAYALGQGTAPPAAIVTTIGLITLLLMPLGALATLGAVRLAGFDLPTHLLLAAAMVTPPQLLMRTGQGPLLGQKRMKELNLGELVVRAVLMALTVPAFLLGALDLDMALWTLAIAQWAGAIVLVAQLLKGLPTRPLPSPALARELIRSGLPFLFGIVGVILFGRVGIWAITGSGDATLVGHYVGALRMTELIAELATAVGVAVFAHGVQADQGGQTALATVRLVRLLTLGMALYALVIGVMAPLLLRLLLGEAYVGEAGALRLMLPGAVLGCQAAMLFPGLSARGQAKLGLLIFGPGTLLHGLLVWLLAPSLGTSGAAIGYTAGQALVAAMVLGAWHQLFGVPLRALLLPDRGDVEGVLRAWVMVRARLGSLGGKRLR